MPTLHRHSSLVVVLITFVVVVVPFALIAAHKCIHDSEIIQNLGKYPPLTIPQPVAENDFNIYNKYAHPQRNDDQHDSIIFNNNRNAEAQAVMPSLDTNRPPMPIFPTNASAAPIRYNFSALDLYDSSKYCTAVGDTRPDFKGSTRTCNLPEEILTTEKRDALVNVLIPYAVQQLSQIFSVMRLTSPMTGITSSTCGGLFSIPQDHIDNGVNNTDYVLYVAAGPTPDGNVAWAAHCATDSSGRPIIGRLNTSPRYVPTPPYTLDVIDSYARTLIHEVMHASGFSSSFFDNGFMSTGSHPPTYETMSVRGGVPAKVMNTSLVVNASRYFYNCSTCSGMELELEGGGGTAGSHWNRRNLLESAMVGIDGLIDSIDLITLALFADMPFYWVNQSMVQPMFFGNNSGCDLLQKTCVDPTLNKKTEELFCGTKTATTGMCDYNLRSRGTCRIENYTVDLPTYWQYFPGQPKLGGQVALMEACPFVAAFSSYLCPRGNLSTGSSNDHIFGQTFGSSSRCFDAPTLIEDKYAPPSGIPTRCLQARCIYDNCMDPFQEYKTCTYRLQVQTRDAPFVDCPLDGTAGDATSTPAGFSGTITCPAANEICHPLSRGWGSDIVYERKTTTTTTTTTTITSTTDASGGTPPPPTTTTTTTTSTTASPTPAPPTVTTIYNLSTTTSTTTTTTTSTPLTSSSTTTLSTPTSQTSVSTSSTATSDPSAVSTMSTTADPNNNGNAGSLVGDIKPAACFLGNLPCYVSYIILGVGGVFVLLILYGIYRKFCGNSGGGDKQTNDHRNGGNQGISPVDLALMGASSTSAPVALGRNGGGLPPSQQQVPQQRNYAQMNRDSKHMSPREVAQNYGGGVAPQQAPPPPRPQSNNNNNFNNSSFSGVSPGARYIDQELQQISPVQKPMALGEVRRQSAVFSIDDDL